MDARRPQERTLLNLNKLLECRCRPDRLCFCKLRTEVIRNSTPLAARMGITQSIDFTISSRVTKERKAYGMQRQIGTRFWEIMLFHSPTQAVATNFLSTCQIILRV